MFALAPHHRKIASAGGFDNIWNAENIFTFNAAGPKEWVADLAITPMDPVAVLYDGPSTENLEAGGTIDIPGALNRPSNTGYDNSFTHPSIILEPPLTVLFLRSTPVSIGTGSLFLFTSCSDVGCGDQTWEYNAVRASCTIGHPNRNAIFQNFSTPINSNFHWTALRLTTEITETELVVEDTIYTPPDSYERIWYPGEKFKTESILSRRINQSGSVTGRFPLFVIFDRYLSGVDYAAIRADPWGPWGGSPPAW